MFTDLESIATVTMCLCFVMSAKMMRTLGWQEVHKIFIQYRPSYATTKYAGMFCLFSIIAQVKQKLQLQNNLTPTAGYRFYLQSEMLLIIFNLFNSTWHLLSDFYRCLVSSLSVLRCRAHVLLKWLLQLNECLRNPIKVHQLHKLCLQRRIEQLVVIFLPRSEPPLLEE